MQSSLKSMFAGVLLVATTLTGTATVAPAGPDRPIIRVMPNVGSDLRIKPGVQDALRDSLRSRCVDLAVFAELRHAGGNTVRIVYGVRNISVADYVSGANQQALVLSRNGRTLEIGRFARLDAGQSLTWTEVVSKPLEFPDTYDAILSIDPDIFQDGNERNDDCNRGNNARQVVVSAT
jgi:hypothetical protein